MQSKQQVDLKKKISHLQSTSKDTDILSLVDFIETILEAREQESVTLKAIKPLINEAINHGSNFIALPECATSLQSNPKQTKKITTTEAENISLQTFIEIAKNNKIYVNLPSCSFQYNNDF